MRIVAGLFLIAHGLIHLAVWLPPYDPATSPFDPKHSWLLARLGRESVGRGLAVVLAVVCATLFVVAGVGVLSDAEWGSSVAVVAAASSLVVTALTFHRWLSFNVIINVAIIVIAA